MKKLSLIFTVIAFIAAKGYSQVYFSENFDGTFSGNPAAPAGWTQNRTVLIGDGVPEANAVDGEKDWQQNINTGVGTWSIPAGFGLSPNAAVSGTGVLWIQDSYFGPGATTLQGSRRMETPVVDLSASTSPYARFWLFCGYTSDRVLLRVMASNDGGATWNPIMFTPPNAGIVGSMANSTPWQRINVLIPSAYRNANCKIGIEMSNTWGTQNIWIDDFSIEEFAPTTITSAATGNWSSTATWVGGVVPTADNNVVIAAGHTVSVDVNIARCQNVSVDGTLQYAGTSTTSLMDILGDLTVNATGLFFSGSGTTGKRTYLGGNFVNNGSANFAPGSSTAGLLAWVGGAPVSYSGTGTLVNSRIPQVWHANSGGVTYNSPVIISSNFSLYIGLVNPNGNLTVGNASLAGTQTIDRAFGSFTVAPTFNNTNITSRSVTYSTPFTTTGMCLGLPPQNITTGEEIEILTGVRTISGTLTMNTHNNLTLSYPLTVGTATTGGFTLTRGIITTTTSNLLTLALTTLTGSTGVTPTTIVGTGVAATVTTQGSYVNGPMRINFPVSTTTARNFPLGVGNSLNNNMPSTNALRLVTLNAGTTAWAGQTITMSIQSAPSGTTNAPITSVMGVRSYKLDLNGGPGLSATASLTLRFNNSTFGGSDNLTGNLQDVRIIQAPAVTGPWSERSTTSGSGAIANNTLYSYTTATASPGPINNGDMFFAWGSAVQLLDMGATGFTSPSNTAGCLGGNQSVIVVIKNLSANTIDFSVNPVTVNCNVTGPNPQTFSPVVINSGVLASNATQNVTVSTTYNMSAGGTYVFNASTSVAGDGNTANDAFNGYSVVNTPISTTASSTPTSFCVGNTSQLNATFNTYSFNSIPYAPLSGTSAPLTGFTDLSNFANNDDGYKNIPLPFTFPFFGSNYNSINVVTNGYVTFGAAATTFSPSAIPNAATPNNFAALCWVDLNLTSGSIDTFRVGTAPFRKFVVQYTNVPYFSFSPNTVSGQIIIYESSGMIDVMVTNVQAAATNKTLGIENSTGTAGYSPAGRNLAQWNASSEGWRFFPAYSFVWTPNGPGTGINTGEETNPMVTANPTTTTTYTVTISNATGCTASATTTVTVNPLPTVTVSGTTTICNGSVTALSASGANTYSWTPATGLSSTTASNPTANPTTTTTYTVTGTSAAGCTGTTTVTITVNPLPTITVSGTTTICNGNNTTLSASGANTYSWSSGGTSSDEIVSPTTTTTYTVTGTDANGCSNTATSTVTVNPLPTVNLGPDMAACGSTVLDAQNAGSTYVWSESSTTQTITVSTSGNYSVVVTDANGCSNSDAINVTINTPPTVALGPDVTQCGGTVVLDAQNAGSTYAWSESSTTQTITVSSTGTYSVVVTDANGCTGTDAIDVTINPLPAVNLGPDITQCGGSVMLDAQNAGSSYAWSTTETTQTITVSTGGTYSVTVTDGNGCSNTDAIDVIINTPPTVNLGADITQCGGNVTLDAQNAGASYSWSDGSNTQTITVGNGTYFVVVTDANGCTGSDTVNVTINPGVTPPSLGNDTTICSPDSILLDAGAGYSSYLWSNGSTDQSIYANATNAYTVTVSNPFGCTASTTINVTVSVCTGTGVSMNENALNVYPNPSEGLVYISSGSDLSLLNIEILDMNGKLVYSSMNKEVKKGFSKELDLSSLADGVYSIRLNTGTGMQVKKLVIRK